MYIDFNIISYKYNSQIKIKNETKRFKEENHNNSCCFLPA